MLNGTDQTAKPYDIYARVSRVKSKKKNEPSTGGQVAICRLRLADLDLPEGKVLVDPGRSAWDPTVRRPAWDELMDRLERGVSGGFIVFDLERFTRQPKDGERMIELAARGLGVLDSESEYDLTTPNGKKAFRDAINAAAYYSDRLSTRARRGKRLKAMSGEPNTTTRPFGFEDDFVTVREAEAEIIRELTRRFLAGETQHALVRDLNARGVLSSKGNPWAVRHPCNFFCSESATAGESSTPTRKQTLSPLPGVCRGSRSFPKTTSTGYARCTPRVGAARRPRRSTCARG